MQINERFGNLADDAAIQKAIAALAGANIQAQAVANAAEAKAEVLKRIPEGSEVMTMTSMTLEALGLTAVFNESGRYRSVRAALLKMDQKTQGMEMKRLGGAHAYVIGSVHAVTQDGHVLVASATGSQLGAYAYGAASVLWVVGAQKIVPNLDEGMKRLHEYSLPYEDARARKAYGIGSGVNKILIVNKEVVPGRIAMIIVKEKLGY